MLRAALMFVGLVQAVPPSPLAFGSTLASGSLSVAERERDVGAVQGASAPVIAEPSAPPPRRIVEQGPSPL